MQVTIKRDCGHREKITVTGGTAATKSAQMFHAQMEPCFICQHERDVEAFAAARRLQQNSAQ